MLVAKVLSSSSNIMIRRLSDSVSSSISLVYAASMTVFLL